MFDLGLEVLVNIVGEMGEDEEADTGSVFKQLLIYMSCRHRAALVFILGHKSGHLITV